MSPPAYHREGKTVREDRRRVFGTSKVLPSDSSEIACILIIHALLKSGRNHAQLKSMHNNDVIITDTGISGEVLVTLT